MLMFRNPAFALMALLVAPFVIGGPRTATSADEVSDTEVEIKEALAELPAADRKLADEQRYCPVMQDHRLGSMGAPLKVMVDGQAVFVCCKSCSKKATEEENLLGSMGKPVKLTIEGQPVFLCCAGCQATAKADPKKTLATAKALKSQKEQTE